MSSDPIEEEIDIKVCTIYREEEASHKARLDERMGLLAAQYKGWKIQVDVHSKVVILIEKKHDG